MNKIVKLLYTFILSEISMLKKISLSKPHELETERQLKKSFDPPGNYIHCVFELHVHHKSPYIRVDSRGNYLFLEHFFK